MRKRIVLGLAASAAAIYLVVFWGIDESTRADCALDSRLECGGFKCNILPSSEYYLGRIYVEEGRLQFPKIFLHGLSWKEQLVEDDFRSEFKNKQPAIVAGEKYTRSTGKAASVAAKELGLSDEELFSEIAANKSEEYGIRRSISEHKLFSLKDSDMNRIHTWFRSQYVGSPAYERRKNDTWATKYYALREIRVTKKMTYRLSGELVGVLGGVAALGRLADIKFFKSGTDDTVYEGQKEFSTELTVCYKAERLNE